MPVRPTRVVIGGGGAAALEALMALHSLAGPRVELALVAPNDEFVYRRMSGHEPFTVGPIRRVPLGRVTRDTDALVFGASVEAVDTEARTISLSDGRSLDYDALVLALGAKAKPAVAHAMTWDDRSEAQMLGGLLADIDDGYTRSVAVVIPPGPVWPLRGYELALVIAREGAGMYGGLATTVVSPTPSPLEILGRRAVEGVSQELDAAGIEVVSADQVDVEAGHTTVLVLQPSGRRLQADRVLALPVFEGRRIAGLLADANGFIDVDDHSRVRGPDGVWAVGDATSFPLKSAGVAAEQADVAAQDIATSAGAAVERRSFDPLNAERLAGLPFGPYLTAWLGDNDGGLTNGVRHDGIAPLTYLERDLAAGWRGDIHR